MEDPQLARGRLEFLSKVAHWMCSVRDWPLIRRLYEAVVDSIELGEEGWTSDFTHYGNMLSMGGQSHVRESGRDMVPKSNKLELYWCKMFQ